MNERIKELAEQAGVTFDSLGASYTFGSLQDFLERFAELVAAAEREACAKVCDDLLANPHRGGGWSDATIECSVAIRARGDKHDTNK